MSDALVLDRVVKTYGDFTAVNEVSFAVSRGEFFGLLGQNGAGKSSIINMICGAARVSGGSITVFGYDTEKSYVETRRRIGVMHQDPVIEQYFSIGKALELHSGYYGVPDDPQWRLEIITRLQLQPHLSKRFLKLSGGLKRRFMLAKALLHKPELLILDEPTAGVDVDLRLALWDFLCEMNQKGTTILLTTHNLEEAEHLCSRVAILKDGELKRIAPTAALIQEIGNQQITLAFDRPVSGDNFFQGLRYEQSDAVTIRFAIFSSDEMKELWQKVSAVAAEVVAIDTVSPDLQDVFLRVTGFNANADSN